MTVEKTANLIVALGINDPEHRLKAKEHIRTIVQRRIEYGNLTKGTKIAYGNLTKGSTLKHADIHTEHEQKVWGIHVNEIVDKHRKMFGDQNEHIPYPLPAGTKIVAAKLFKKQYAGEVKEIMAKMQKGLSKCDISCGEGIDEDDISGGKGLSKSNISKGTTITKSKIARKTTIGKCDITKGTTITKGKISGGKGLKKSNISKK